jgi:hypothetical protein
MKPGEGMDGLLSKKEKIPPHLGVDGKIKVS